MIETEQAAMVTEREIARFRAALLDGFGMLELIRQGIDPIIVEAQDRSLREQLANLEAELAEYRSRHLSPTGRETSGEET